MNSELKAKNATQWFNLALGMAQYCTNLADFHTLLDARRRASHDDAGNPQASLDTFIVKGKWVLDEFGQVGTLIDIHDMKDYSIIAKERLPEFPLVIQVDDFKKLIEDHLRPKIGWQFGFGGIPTPASIPPGSRCKICNEVITLETFSEIIFGEREDFTKEEAEAILGDLSGLTIHGIEELLSEHYHALVHVYMKNGQDRTTENFDFYIVQYLAHAGCYQKVLDSDARKRFSSAITDAGIESFGNIRIKNEYGSEAYRGTWFIFDTSIGNLKLGWRKHVINIDYSEIDPEYIAKTNLTVGTGFEHVNSYEGLSEALEKFTIYLFEKE